MEATNFSPIRELPQASQAQLPATTGAAQPPAFADFKGGYDTIGSRADHSMNELGRMLEGLGNLAESLGEH